MQLLEEITSHVAEAVEMLTRDGMLERHRLEDGSEVFGCKSSQCVTSSNDPYS